MTPGGAKCYTKQERLDIGRQVHTHELSHKEAMDKYGLCNASIDNYVVAYRKANDIHGTTKKASTPCIRKVKPASTPDIEAYMSMSKEELIDELIRSKVNEARAKKGYKVKGDGPSKEFISLSNKNFR